MDPIHEVKLKCLGLAIDHARIRGNLGDVNFIEETSTRFYNHIVGPAEVVAPEPEAELETRKPGRKPKDKAIDPFS